VKAHQLATLLAAALLLVMMNRLFPQTGRLILSAASVLLKFMAFLKA
jgi:hypothetical protein